MLKEVGLRLAGKVAVILGASDEAGSGWAIAERFAAEGARVVVAARRLEEVQRLADRIGGHAAACDACKEADIRNLADAVIERHGKLDIAINAAGGTTQVTIADAQEADIMAALQLNYVAHFQFVRHMAARMDAGGSIILFSSMASTHPIEHLATYACAKAATNCLVKYAALEYGPRNIRVNAILPGTIASAQAKAFLAIPGMMDLATREVPLGRVGEPADYSDAALWLAGDAFVTGLNLQVSGGNQLTRFPRATERAALSPDVYNLGGDATTG